MKKNHIFFTIFFIFLLGSVFLSCSKSNSERKSQVIVYAYDSFVTEYGPAAEIARLFKEKTNLDVIWTDCGDGGQILSKAISEKEKPYADVILGIDNNISRQAYESGILQNYKPKNADSVIEKSFSRSLNSYSQDEWILTPYDYSHFAIIWDSLSSVEAPESLEDLTKSEYKNKLILMDPRTSTPGLGFVAWTVAVFKNEYKTFWENLKPSILTMSPGWSSGYGLFTEGEAPLVSSYTTSPAYHVEYGEGDRFKALIFDQGHVMQVEGAGILKGAENLEGAKKFIDFLITEEAQNVLPLTQWMFPVNKNVKMPQSYSVAAPIPTKTLDYSSEDVQKAVLEIMAILSR